MAPTTLSIILGSFITVMAISSILLNCFVLFIFIKGKLISRFSSSFYILSFANMIACSFLVIPYLFYLSPSAIFQDRLVPADAYKAIGCFCLAMWGQNQFMQVLIAINRLAIVVYPKTQLFFTSQNTVILIILTFVFGFVMAIFAQYNVSCCSYSLYYVTYSPLFVGESFSVNSYFIYMPFNILCSSTAIICYVTLYIFVKTSNTKTGFNISRNLQIKRKAREQKYAFQFSFCTVCSIIAWAIVRVLGITTDSKTSPFYIIATVCILIHTASNSFVFLLFNTDIHECLKRMLFKNYTTKLSLTVLPCSGRLQTRTV